MQRNLIISCIRSVLNDIPDVDVAILFGSAAENRLRADSDVDIAVAGKKVFEKKQLDEISMQLCRVLNRQIDLVDLTHVKGLLFHQVMSKGTVVISKDINLMVRFMTETVYYAADLLPSVTGILDIRAWEFANG